MLPNWNRTKTILNNYQIVMDHSDDKEEKQNTKQYGR